MEAATGHPAGEMGEAVRLANRSVYNSKSLEEYNRNPSIFNDFQTRRIRAILEELRARTRGRSFLDVGCGTGNLLRIAREIFPQVQGVDQAERLLRQVRRKEALSCLASAQAGRLPFAEASFDVVGMYALLHHLFDPGPALREAFRVLRRGGILYTDHDPNRHFCRFYHPLYRLRYRKRHGFGSALQDLAEYHHVHSPGLDPERLAGELGGMGFSSVEVVYRHSSNRSLGGWRGLALQALKGVSRLAPLRCFHTHFMVLARK